MARQRRGPELRGTLGTLLRTTLAQAGNLREALERGAREGRFRVEDVLASRRRTDALADLGEIVLDLVRRGEIDIDELPEIRELVAHLDELDASDDDRDRDDRDRARADIAPAPTRKRFDTRDRARRRDARDHDDTDDGTVSSSWAPPKRAAPAARVWRPPADAAPAAKPALKHAGGGIRFDDDDDLAEYMHPDDVPKKPDS